MQRLATEGLGIALLLRHTTSPSVRDGRLVALGLDPQLFADTIDLVTFRDRTLPAAVRQFLLVLQNEIGH